MKPAQAISTREAIGMAYKSYNRARPAIQGGLDRDTRHPHWTRQVLDQLGAPDRKAYNVAVTGSKGKGSHAILLAAMLQRAGLKVGLFTGPHLVDFMERFRVNGQVMPEPRFVDYMQQVFPLVEALPLPPHHYVGPVGILAAVAALWFRDEQTDVNVYELGRGALHDDVNQVMHQGAVVAPIFLEHPLQLGPTVHDVAVEKAGIVTDETVWVCSYAQTGEVRPVLLDACGVRQAHFRELGSTFTHEWKRHPDGSVQVVVKPSDGPATTLYLAATLSPFVGNAAVALDAALQVWRGLGRTDPFPTTLDLRDIRLPGRLQVIRESPWMVVDGTIHADSARMVMNWVREMQPLWQFDQVGAVLALPADKDGDGVVAQIATLANWAVIARAKNPHLTFDDGVLKAAQARMSDVVAADDLADAMARISPRLGPRSLLLLLGTQSFVGDVLAYFQSDSRRIFQTSSMEEDSSFYFNLSYSEQRWV
ncbi:MAG: bifunctional folylpolyglutamate synthase/dihydrofolate synthase [Alicyclobacillus sp.]|nr:bifunctional folylpolyglutamate synthase/dihydrofolate synthase [Alicyclobacillus sp.]